MNIIDIKLFAIVIICLISACGVQDQLPKAKNEDSTVTASTEATSKDAEVEAPIGGVEAPESTDESQVFNDNLLAMKDTLAETYTAVEAGDFPTAKTSFLEARQTWFGFGGSIKEKFADNYQTLDQGVKIINTNINKSEPAKDTLLTNLETITNELDLVFSE